MARKATVLEPEDDLQELVAPIPVAEEIPAPVEFPLVDVLIELPTKQVDDKFYRSRFIEITSLSKHQADAAKALFEGLHASSARLANGRYVKSPADAVRYVLEAIHGQLSEPSDK